MSNCFVCQNSTSCHIKFLNFPFSQKWNACNIILQFSFIRMMIPLTNLVQYNLKINETNGKTYGIFFFYLYIHNSETS